MREKGKRMLVVLLRHAEKLNSYGNDPELSPRGYQDAQKLLLQVGQLIPRPNALWSSPKQRAQQTLEPIAQKLSLEIKTMPELNERQASETTTQFSARVQQIFQVLSSQAFGTTTVWLCTHADWLAEAVTSIPSDLSDPEFEASFLNCQHRVFAWTGGIWHFYPSWKGEK